MKEKSDYNRNIYLDILEDTRQDKELESRYQALEKEAGQLNVVLSLVIVGFVLVSLFFWFFNKRSKDRNRVHLRRLQLMLDICQKITASIPADAQTEEEIVDSIRTAVCPAAGSQDHVNDRKENLDGKDDREYGSQPPWNPDPLPGDFAHHRRDQLCSRICFPAGSTL